MTKAQGGSGQWQEYTYDGEGQRVRRMLQSRKSSTTYSAIDTLTSGSLKLVGMARSAYQSGCDKVHSSIGHE